ncbi:MAG: hypothetical protein HY909_21155 [Deltaproteobacteria bacterium]|nr:hypothetical protein [Deltaproteobacteria bacterium]
MRVARLVSTVSAAGVALLALACGGPQPFDPYGANRAPPENSDKRRPGGGTAFGPPPAGREPPPYLRPLVQARDGGVELLREVRVGALSVDPDTERVLFAFEGPSGARSILGVDPDDGTAHEAATSRTPGGLWTQAAFLQGSLLVRQGGFVRELDPRTYAERAGLAARAMWPSPDGRWLAYAPSSGDRLLQVWDPRDRRDVLTEPLSGAAMVVWSPGGERLFLGEWLWPEADGGLGVLRVRVWTAGSWAIPTLEYRASGESPAFRVGLEGNVFTVDGPWMVASLDGSRVAFGVHDDTGEKVTVVDLVARAVRTLRGVRGPLALSGNGQHLLAWRGPPGGQTLVRLDVATGVASDVPTECARHTRMLVPRASEVLALGCADASGSAALYDPSGNTRTLLQGLHTAFDQATLREGREELWVADRGLHRIDLRARTLDTVALGWRPSVIAYLPRHDLLALDVPGHEHLVFWSPATRAIVRDVVLPIPE